MTSPHFKAFYDFMLERESIRLKKEAGQPWPWTGDRIFQAYKFTNVRRSDDRTTRELKKNMYEPHAGAPFVVHLLNAGIARYFGRWEFVREIGWLEDWESSQIERVIHLAQHRMADKLPVFTGAYVITNQGMRAPKENVVCMFVTNLWRAAPSLAAVVKETNRWQPLIAGLRGVEGFGGTGFMAKEVVLDTMLLPGTWPEGGPTDRNEWCPSGPGARRGAARVMGQTVPGNGLSERDTFQVMKSLFDLREQLWRPDYVELELHDVQFQLCEFDKYQRVLLGQGRPRSLYHPPRVAL